ncbi:exo-beta-N-acetylmuramidase NamZ domain-containing protein [Belliella marina]|uniref:Exo-beta-N-acetylmuramidase NamZ domain-containing protein n=1 Tax=Belliella marina TaxID=1644146 RepID=A0ABW4VU48_9BACT
MKQLKIVLLISFLLQSFAFCKSPETKKEQTTPEISEKQPDNILPGADRPEEYLSLLEGKKIGLVVNQTSILTSKNNIHLVDYLMMEGIDVVKVFVPEHGFRGDADAGEVVNNEVDSRTGLPIESLYGNNKKPSAASLKGLDMIIYDLQDVGLRFYTYISTMHYVMESAAENQVPLLILDRPNPNGEYIDGPVLKKGFESFVGMHPIPVVHGLTVAELANMINGEGWLKNKVKADIKIIEVANWTKETPYNLPVKPSPNLPNDLSIRLYPSLCFFEGTDISVGRGTYFPFQVYGYPDKKFGEFSFKPVSIDGMSKNPPHQNKVCYGKDLREEALTHQFTLEYLIDAYQTSGKKEKFFNNFFDKLAGTDQLRKDILAGKPTEEIKESWQSDLEKFKEQSKPYLLY